MRSSASGIDEVERAVLAAYGGFDAGSLECGDALAGG